MDAKPYLDYLDKEMTIMGILSAVSIAAPAAILNSFMSEHPGSLNTDLWKEERFFIVFGSILCVAAAMLFYKERSRLAWFHGQISLTGVLEDAISSPAELRELLREADSWETWIPYSWGFTTLISAAMFYMFAILLFLISPSSRILSQHLTTVRVILSVGIVVVAVLIACLQRHVWGRYKFNEEPWGDFWTDITHGFNQKLPHEGVYARLRPSQVSGVGVFAIRDIPKGTYIFEPDDEDLRSVRAESVKALPDYVQKLYHDFCVLKSGKYECPASFNRLTPSWFLNHSKAPNVAPDASLRFYAIRAIQDGEELTADYSTYSENDTAFPEPRGLV